MALDSYTAKSDDELTYRAGEEVEVLATSNFGWWKIRWERRLIPDSRTFS